MIVNKFGGASVKDADAIRVLADIVAKHEDNTIVVVSAMGKTTNKLEQIVRLKMENDDSYNDVLASLMNEHQQTLDELFSSNSNAIFSDVINLFSQINKQLSEYTGDDYDYLYDQVVSIGEILSTRIVSAYLTEAGIRNKWIDIRKYLQTDSFYREARVVNEVSKKKIRKAFVFNDENIFVTQGFIGADQTGNTTTLGREGSDYTAALLANMLDAEKVVLWKDVDGIFNADPKLFEEVRIFRELSYHEAIELSFYGAKIIHPKTIKPVQNKNIPLYVKNFNNPETDGSVIYSVDNFKSAFPVFIIKNEQILISVTPNDYSFVVEKHISHFFTVLNQQKAKVNLIQNSAVSFSVCCDRISSKKLEMLLSCLRNDFRVLYNENLELITIRHYNKAAIAKMLNGRKILMEQRSRNTVQFVVS